MAVNCITNRYIDRTIKRADRNVVVRRGRYERSELALERGDEHCDFIHPHLGRRRFLANAERAPVQRIRKGPPELEWDRTRCIA